jgi:hypothetical protein
MEIEMVFNRDPTGSVHRLPQRLPGRDEKTRGAVDLFLARVPTQGKPHRACATSGTAVAASVGDIASTVTGRRLGRTARAPVAAPPVTSEN